MSALDYSIPSATASLDPSVQRMREQRRKQIQADILLQMREDAAAKAEERAAAQEQRAIEDQGIQRDQVEQQKRENALKLQAETSKAQIPIAATDAMQWMINPQYQKPFDQAPEEAKRHFISAYDPTVAAQAPQLWNKALIDSTGKVPGTEGMIQEVKVDPVTGVSRSFTSPPTPKSGETGLIFDTPEAAEAAGYTPEGGDVLDDGRIKITKLARTDRSRQKLDVSQRRDLTGAVTAVSALKSIQDKYDELEKDGKVGPVVGRFQSAKQGIGYGDRDFAEFNSQVQGNLFNLARALQGAGVLTEQDVKRMEAIVPTGQMAPDQFKGQLSGVRSLMLDKLNAWKIASAHSLKPDELEQVNTVLSELTGDIDRKKNLPPAAKPASTPAPTAAPTAPKSGIEIIERNGKRYEVNHDTKAVREVQ